MAKQDPRAAAFAETFRSEIQDEVAPKALEKIVKAAVKALPPAEEFTIEAAYALVGQKLGIKANGAPKQAKATTQRVTKPKPDEAAPAAPPAPKRQLPKDATTSAGSEDKHLYWAVYRREKGDSPHAGDAERIAAAAPENLARKVEQTRARIEKEGDAEAPPPELSPEERAALAPAPTEAAPEAAPEPPDARASRLGL